MIICSPWLLWSLCVFCATVVLSLQSFISAFQPAPTSFIDPLLFPVQYPLAMWSKCLAQVLPDPGKLEIAVIFWPCSGLKNLKSAAQSWPSVMFGKTSQKGSLTWRVIGWGYSRLGSIFGFEEGFVWVFAAGTWAGDFWGTGFGRWFKFSKVFWRQRRRYLHVLFLSARGMIATCWRQMRRAPNR